jgi:hypothetical protein
LLRRGRIRPGDTTGSGSVVMAVSTGCCSLFMLCPVMSRRVADETSRCRNRGMPDIPLNSKTYPPSDAGTAGPNTVLKNESTRVPSAWVSGTIRGRAGGRRGASGARGGVRGACGDCCNHINNYTAHVGGTNTTYRGYVSRYVNARWYHAHRPAFTTAQGALFNVKAGVVDTCFAHDHVEHWVVTCMPTLPSPCSRAVVTCNARTRIRLP